MKTKILIALTLIPSIGSAHPGHQHHLVDIILNPAVWLDHPEFLALLGFVLLVVTVRLVRKYPLVRKMNFDK